MIELVDGKIYKEGKEIPADTPLTDAELDCIIKQFDPSIPSTREWSKRQSSWSGVGWYNMDWFESSWVWGFQEDALCYVAEQVYAAGGVRLLTLYCNKFNFFSAATDLGITYAALVKWFQRWRKAALASGITPESLGLVPAIQSFSIQRDT